MLHIALHNILTVPRNSDSAPNILPHSERRKKFSYILVILQENMKIAIFAEHRMRRNPLKEDFM